MNATPQRVQSDEPVIEPLGPGPRLRAARERLEMSLDQVGDRLHLHVSTVEALESNAYGELPAPTFVRGYLRGYAQLVGLAPEPVVDEFDSQGLAPPALVADISEGPQARTSDLPMRLATWAILAALVLLVVMWWNSQTSGVDIGTGAPVVEDTDDGTSATSAPAAATAAPAPGPDEASEPEAEPVSPEPSAMPTTARTSGSDVPGPDTAALAQPARAEVDAPSADPPLAAAPEPEPEIAPEPEPVPADEGVADLDLQPTPTMTPSTPAPAPSAEPEAVASAMTGLDPDPPESMAAEATDPQPPLGGSIEPAPEPEQGAGSDPGSIALTLAPTTDPAAQALVESSATVTAGEERLVLRFAAESWVEIYDRDEQRLYFNLVEPDGVIDVAGPGPLRVLLGRAEGVVAAHNGERLDIAPYMSRGGIARFTVGGPSSGQ